MQNSYAISWCAASATRPRCDRLDNINPAFYTQVTQQVWLTPWCGLDENEPSRLDMYMLDASCNAGMLVSDRGKDAMFKHSMAYQEHTSH